MQIDIDKLAKLSRLSLTDEEKQKYQQQVGNILDAMDVLNKANLDNVAALHSPTDTYHEYQDAKSLREDEAQTMNPEKIMENAHQTHEGHFLVPQVIERKA
jgi:aspartyl-tRNA(Asn)/glutamyl-tRNA(Gln) amidotransferase subunit C